jgi:hypothetical protein
MKAVWVALALLLSAGAALLSAGSALAQTPDGNCTFTAGQSEKLFVGITHQTIDISCPTSGNNPPALSKAHVVRVDLDAPGLSFEASTWAEGQTSFRFDLPTAFLERTRAQVAINANLFSGCCTDYPTNGLSTLCGLEISRGKVLEAANMTAGCPSGHPFDTSLIAFGNALRIVPSASVGHGVDADVAITGSDKLVSGGNNVAPSGSGDWYGDNARTVVGLSENNKVLWLAAVDQVDGSAGVTLYQAAAMMISLGATTALNLDGAGSTALAVQGTNDRARLLNVPSDHPGDWKRCSFRVDPIYCERYVGAVFAIIAHGRTGSP